MRNGNRVKTVWEVMYRQSGQGRVRVPSQLAWNRWSAEAERSIAPSGGYGELETVEQVEPGSAVVDEGGLAVAWQEFAVRTAKSSG